MSKRNIITLTTKAYDKIKMLLERENKKSILIYIIEPELWKQKDMSLRQWQFTLESVNELKRQLLRNNLHLNIFFGDALEIFKFLKDKYYFSSVISGTGVVSSHKLYFHKLNQNQLEY